MKQTLKKSVSILLSLIMVFSLFTIVPITAYAEETEQPVLYAIATEDKYGDPNRMIGVLYYDSDGEMHTMKVSPIKLTSTTGSNRPIFLTATPFGLNRYVKLDIVFSMCL